MSLLAFALAFAPDSNLELEWRAPPACPDAARVRDDVVSMMGDAELPPVFARGVVEQDPIGNWSLALRIETEDGVLSRAMNARDCDTLARVTALHVVVAAAPEWALEIASEAPDGDDSPAMSTPTAKHVAAPSPERERPPNALRLRGAVRADAGVGVGGIATPSAVTGFALALLAKRWRAEATFSGWLPRTIAAADAHDAGITLWWGSAGVRGCPRFVRRALEGQACAGVEAGAAVARGYGVSDARAASSPFVGVATSAAFAWAPSERLAAWLGAEMIATVVRPGFEIAGLGEIGRFGPVLGRFSLGLEFRWPASSAG